MHRSGAALILALILLAALLLMGLPFLFSQSSSLSGTRSFADSKSAQIARDSSENLAVAIAAYAIERSLRVSAAPDLTDWSSLTGTFAPENTLTPAALRDAAIVTDTYDIALKADKLPALGYNAPNARILIGATISDEAGKLNPNAMSAEVWARFMQAVNILDWDDNEVVKVPNNNTWSEDGDNLPQLAQALAQLRQRLPGGRITHFEQLLEADPQQGGIYKNLRHRLTRAELELIRPHLTLHNPGPGRRGLIDLGSVVANDPKYPTWYLDSNPPAASLIAYDTVLVGESTDTATGAHARAFVRDGMTDTSVLWNRRVTNDKLVSSGKTGERIAIEAPGSINFHQMSTPVRAALGDSAPLPAPIPDASILAEAGLVKLYRTYGSLTKVFLSMSGATPVYGDYFPWTSPLGLAGSGRPRTAETPPIGIRSLGIVEIEA
ncbi:MAG: hypothetical protein H0W83_02420, partial [Planctomycetes bacterium]|nr:hypothetical protein [Planctomycetota bacterium]